MSLIHRRQVARKEYVCSDCGGTIQPGESYTVTVQLPGWYWTSPDDKDWFGFGTYKSHTDGGYCLGV